MRGFSYDQTYQPPAPTCAIALAVTEGEAVHLVALVDTGADATLIPVRHLQAIGARRVFEMSMRSQWGEQRTVFLYLVDVRIANITLPGLYVVGDEWGAEVILGRDVLNRLRLMLDGPALLMRIMG